MIKKGEFFSPLGCLEISHRSDYPLLNQGLNFVAFPLLKSNNKLGNLKQINNRESLYKLPLVLLKKLMVYRVV